MTLMTLQTSMAIGAVLLAVAGCSPKPALEPNVPASGAETRSASSPSAASSASTLAAGGSARCPGCAENFAVFDTDTDQRVSLQEFLARPHTTPDPEAVFRARDGNGDGYLTAAEFCSRSSPRGAPDDCAGSAAYDYKGRTVTSVAEQRRSIPRLGQGKSVQELTCMLRGFQLPYPRTIVQNRRELMLVGTP